MDALVRRCSTTLAGAADARPLPSSKNIAGVPVPRRRCASPRLRCDGEPHMPQALGAACQSSIQLRQAYVRDFMTQMLSALASDA